MELLAIVRFTAVDSCRVRDKNIDTTKKGANKIENLIHAEISSVMLYIFNVFGRAILPRSSLTARIVCGRGLGI